MPTPEDREPSLEGLRVLAHPVRLRLLSLLTGTAMSAAEAARHLGQSQANVSYHVRRLHAAGLLDLVEHAGVRGGRAKRYRHDPTSGEGLRARDAEDQQAFAMVLGEELRRRTGAQHPDSPGAFTDAELWVSPRAWHEALSLLRRAGRVLHEAAQPPRAPGTVRVSATVWAFVMRPGSLHGPADPHPERPAQPLDRGTDSAEDQR